MALRKLFSVLLPFLIMVHMPTFNGQTSDDAKNLTNNLFNINAYNKAVRPTFYQKETLNVYIIFVLLEIIEFDSQKETLTTSGYFSIFWYDFYLQWDPLDYGNLYRIDIPQDKVWKPDITVLNRVSDLRGIGYSDISLDVYYHGAVLWTSLEIVKSTCSVDITYFPFDIQTCTLILLSWSYDSTEVRFNMLHRKTILDSYEENSEWSMVRTNMYTGVYSWTPSVAITITLKRKPLYYLLNVILPVIMLSLLNVCIFVLPAESGEKASFSVTIFLSLAVFLTIVTTTLPQNSDQISFLGIYLVTMVAFSTLIVMLTMFQIRLNFRDVDVDPIPSWMIKLQVIVEIVQCRRCNKVHPERQNRDEVAIFSSGHEISETTTSEQSRPNEQPTVTWKQICCALDFVFFWIFFIATVIITVTLFVICSTFKEIQDDKKFLKTIFKIFD